MDWVYNGALHNPLSENKNSSSCRGSDLVFLLDFLVFLKRIAGNFFVIALKGGQILTSFREFTFLHTFTNIPVHESALGVHEIELVVESRPGLGNSGCVGQHANCAVDLGEIAVGHHLGRLVADTDLETSRAPVDELDGTLGLEGCNGSVGLLGDDITTVQKAGSHVLAVTWVTLNHLVVGLEAGHCDLVDRVGLVEGLGSRDNWSIGNQWEVDTRVWHKVSLELVQVDVEGSIESERSSDGRHNLSDKTVKVVIARTLDTEVAAADIVDSFVVDHEAAVGVLQGGVCSKNGVVWLNDGSGVLGSWVDAELELGLLAIVDRETLHQKSTESGTGTTTEGVENEEALKTGAVVGNTTDLVQNTVDHLLADGVVTTGIVV